jgi:hypothetical protein
VRARLASLIVSLQTQFAFFQVSFVHLRASGMFNHAVARADAASTLFTVSSDGSVLALQPELAPVVVVARIPTWHVAASARTHASLAFAGHARCLVSSGDGNLHLYDWCGCICARFPVDS